MLIFGFVFIGLYVIFHCKKEAFTTTKEIDSPLTKILVTIAIIIFIGIMAWDFIDTMFK